MQKQKIYYPVNLDLNGRQCLVIGGGKVASRKVKALLDFGADVTVLSPVVDKSIDVYRRSARFSVIKDKYHRKYLKNVFLIVAATDDPLVNTQVACHAAQKNTLINVVDVPELCNFIVPSIVRRGPLVMGISTSGHSPMFAQKLRHKCGPCVNQYGLFITMLGQARATVKARFVTMSARKAIYRKILVSPVLGLLKKGQVDKAKALMQRIIAKG